MEKDVPAEVVHYHQGDKIKVPTGGRIVPVHCGKDYDDEKVEKQYLPIYMAFDIETTNIIRGEHKAAYMYIAQCCMATHKAAYIYYFRTWDDVIFFFKGLSTYLLLGKVRRLICLIANCGFEFQFLRHRLTWMQGKFDFFAKEARQPLLATSMGIEFREALSISGGSLASLAKDFCRTQKLKGELDYNIERNSNTVLDPIHEMQYCFNDVIILAEFAEYLFTKYIRPNHKVPLTKTGLLRAEQKDYFKHQPNWMQMKQLLHDMFPSKVQYDFWFEFLFRGGYVHSNVLYAGQLLKNLLCFDITSSYPAQINLRGYPMTKFEPWEFTTMEEFEALMKTHCVIFVARFTGVERTTGHAIESISKCIDYENCLVENGRIAASHIIDKETHERKEGFFTVALTEVDWQIYKKFYRWNEDPYIYDVYVAERKRLPKYVRDVLNGHYKNKSEMKRKGWHKDPDHVADYSIEKSGCNSFYGMMVTRMQEETVRYQNDWCVRKEDFDYEREVNSQILLPQWGIYVCAWGRWQLLDTVWKITQKCGDIVCYMDTDSIKMLYHPEAIKVIEEVNKEIARLLNKFGLTNPAFSDLGMFDREADYIRAKFLGAKRYLSEKLNEKTGEKEICATIAGLPKDAILKLPPDEDVFKFFSDDGMLIDAEISGKLGHAYIDNETHDIVAGEAMTELSSICLFPMTFEMNIEAGYHAMMLEYMKESEVIYYEDFERT